jgi:hypothetical protein
MPRASPADRHPTCEARSAGDNRRACAPSRRSARAPRSSRWVLVDVVAEEQHDVRIVPTHVPIGAEIAVLPPLARRVRDPQTGRRGLGCRKRPGAPDGALRVADHEAVVVPAVGLETRHFDVDRVRERGCGDGLPLLHDPAELLVMRNLPPYGDGIQPQARSEESLRMKPRPQYDRVVRRRTACHAKRERVACDAGLAPRASRQPEGRGARRGELQQASAGRSTPGGSRRTARRVRPGKDRPRCRWYRRCSLVTRRPDVLGERPRSSERVIG